ncbi:MAG TPA: hypothetical protein VGK27_05590 [Candidatus Deferrimicrobiaceae bacterium]|jgi:hypothetical protein
MQTLNNEVSNAIRKAKALDAASFDDAFSKFWSALSIQFFKFERLQSYYEPDDPSYQAFQQKDMDSAIQHLENRIEALHLFYEQAARKNVSIIRMRAVEKPLSEYLNYEFESYRISSKYGERILVVDLTNIDHSSDLYIASDFLMFDAKTVLVHNYDKNGQSNGGWLIDDLDDVRVFADLATRYHEISIPFGHFERQNRLK